MYFWEQIDGPALEPLILTRLVYIGAHQFEFQGIW